MGQLTVHRKYFQVKFELELFALINQQAENFFTFFYHKITLSLVEIIGFKFSLKNTILSSKIYIFKNVVEIGDTTYKHI